MTGWPLPLQELGADKGMPAADSFPPPFISVSLWRDPEISPW